MEDSIARCTIPQSDPKSRHSIPKSCPGDHLLSCMQSSWHSKPCLHWFQNIRGPIWFDWISTLKLAFYYHMIWLNYIKENKNLCIVLFICLIELHWKKQNLLHYSIIIWLIELHWKKQNLFFSSDLKYCCCNFQFRLGYTCILIHSKDLRL